MSVRDTLVDIDVIRRAATLMHTRAKAASPGPWCYYMGDLWRGKAEALHAYDADPENAPWPYGPDEQLHLFAGDPEQPGDAEYIAAMPPEFLRTVAYWLDGLVACVDQGLPNRTVDEEIAAMQVARAYLNEETT